MPSDWLQIKLQVFSLVIENMNFLFAYSAFVWYLGVVPMFGVLVPRCIDMYC
jgi:hypothetical protein